MVYFVLLFFFFFHSLKMKTISKTQLLFIILEDIFTFSADRKWVEVHTLIL